MPRRHFLMADLLWAKRDKRAEDKAERERIRAALQELYAKRALNETRRRTGGWS